MYQTDGAGEIRPYSFICSEAGMDSQPALLSAKLHYGGHPEKASTGQTSRTKLDIPQASSDMVRQDSARLPSARYGQLDNSRSYCLNNKS